jgi:Zn-dependent peptidase ImmA (M78 family)
MPLDTKALDSFSCWRKEQQRPYIVLGIEKEAAARSRFSLAHELGHMILHRNVEQELMRNTQAFKQMEEQAFRFAGAFLLPRKTFTKSFRKPSIASLTSLKYEWNVSIAAMLMRARDLDLLSKEEETRLWRNYSRRGYRKREPLDDEVPRERPAVLEQSIQLLVNEQVQSRDQICANVPLVPSEIEALAGLPSGFLSHQSQIKLRRSNEPSR